jgi:glutamyl-tRNA synthetase
MNLNELAQQFNLAHLSKAPAKFDQAQLVFWQKLTIQSMTSQEFWDWIEPLAGHLVPPDKKNEFIETVKPNVVVPEDAFFWADIFFKTLWYFDSDALAVMQEAGEIFFNEALKKLMDLTDLKQLIPAIQESCHLSGQKLYMPIRVALTGQRHGPELIRVMNLLGVAGVRQRFQQAAKDARGA